MNIDKLKKVIQEAVPEIMALEFGCQLKSRDNGDIWSLINKFQRRNEEWFLICHEKTGQGQGLPIDFEILGRPIRLADVLLAIGKVPGIFIVVSDNGRFHKRIAEKEYQELGDWNCAKDNLDDQSDECKAFLISLLVR